MSYDIADSRDIGNQDDGHAVLFFRRQLRRHDTLSALLAFINRFHACYVLLIACAFCELGVLTVGLWALHRHSPFLQYDISFVSRAVVEGSPVITALPALVC